MNECDFDHSFNGTENEIGLRPGEQGPQPPIQTKGPRYYKELERLEKLMKSREKGSLDMGFKI